MNLYLTAEERQKLEATRIGIAGVGGLGSNCAAHLVRAGIQNLVICDFDSVSESNLNRQFYFAEQVGEKKVVALETNLRRIDPDVKIEVHDTRLDETNVRTIFAGCDYVIEALDCVEAKTALLAALMAAGKKVVAASGMAGWGRSEAIRVKRIGANLVLVGDGESSVTKSAPPESARVGLVAAMQANSLLAWILNKEL